MEDIKILLVIYLQTIARNQLIDMMYVIIYFLSAILQNAHFNTGILLFVVKFTIKNFRSDDKI